MFNGTNPQREMVTARFLLNHMEAARKVTPLPDLQMIVQTVSKFVPKGAAHNWWQEQLQRRHASDGFPFDGRWEAFCEAFLLSSLGRRRAFNCDCSSKGCACAMDS
jgi:hypothetical protein